MGKRAREQGMSEKNVNSTQGNMAASMRLNCNGRDL